MLQSTGTDVFGSQIDLLGDFGDFLHGIVRKDQFHPFGAQQCDILQQQCILRFRENTEKVMTIQGIQSHPDGESDPEARESGQRA